MKQLPEEIFSQALAKLKSGSSTQEILSVWPEYKQELGPLLDISKALIDLPKKPAPEPAMQRRYVFAPARRMWFAWLHLSKFAGVSVSMLLLISAVAGTGYAASKSVPGQTLFGLKKTSEQLRLKMATNPVDKANLQVEITKKRLSEAEQVFKNPERSSKQELAALNELSKETKNTIDVVSSVAKTAPEPEKNHPLVASLEDINKQQQSLLSEIQPSAATENAIKDTQENVIKVAEAKNYLQAASNDRALVDLNVNPAVVIATGTITQISPDKIVVDGKIITITQTTVVQNADGGQLKLSDLNTKLQVSVDGNKDNDALTALKITVQSSEQKEPGSVKGESTKTASSSVPKIITPTSTSATETPAQTDPNTAVGTFIFEDPSPQSPF